MLALICSKLFHTMIKQLTALLPFLVILTAASSCSKPQGFDYKSMQNFKIQQLGFNKSKVSMDLVYYNPNNFAVDLKKVDCEIKLDNNYVGRFVLDTLMHIPKKADFAIPAQMEVDMRNIFKNAFDVLFNKEVTVGAKGTTRVGKAGVFVTVPFNYEGKHSFEMF
jgi:LEA14-like dessication related protein